MKRRLGIRNYRLFKPFDRPAEPAAIAGPEGVLSRPVLERAALGTSATVYPAEIAKDTGKDRQHAVRANAVSFARLPLPLRVFEPPALLRTRHQGARVQYT